MSAFWQQVATLYRRLSAAQRASVVVAALAVGAGITWVATNRPQTAYVPVLSGRSFDKEELVTARKQLAAAGLTDIQVKGRQILAPRAETARYETALTSDKAGETGWAGAWQQANASLSPFATGRQQQDAREIARARLISDLLAQLPDVAQAEIVWDEEPRVGWRQPPRVRATVYLQPRERREITRDVVEAVRQAVAGSKAHLDPTDIVVLDLQRMVAWGPGSGNDGTAADEQRLAVMTAAYRQRIEDALADMDGVRVAVVVEPVEAGISAVLTEQPLPRALPAVSVTPPTSGEFRSRGRSKASGGPNVRLEVPRTVDESNIGTLAGIHVAAAAEANRVIEPPVRPATERVSVTVSLAPEYVRQQAESLHTAAAFTRMPAVQQQAMLADIERSVGRNVRERVASIIPGATLEERLARVQVVPQLAFVADQSGIIAEGASQKEAAALAAHTDRFTRWGSVGVMACLGLWTLFHIAQVLRGRRNSRFISQNGAERSTDSMPTVASAARTNVPDRVAELLAALAGPDADGWTNQVAGESPQVIAALLKALPPERVGGVLAGLSVDVQREVLAQFAGIDSTAPVGTGVLQPVQRRNAPRAGRRETVSAPRHRGWLQRLRGVDSRLGQAGWDESTAAIYEEAVHLDQITDLDPAFLRVRYADLPVEVWSTALMGASSAFRVRLLSALPAADAAALRQALTRQRPSRLSEIESAQSQVLELLNGRAAVATEAL
jgi:hypothetical protein